MLIVVVGFIKLSSVKSLNVPVKSFVIISASMEPTIMTGDIILVRPGAAVGVGDVITFVNNEGVTITHRIVEEGLTDGRRSFVTEGDNNEAPEPYPVFEDQIIGKYWVTLRYFGYAVVYGQKPLGMLIIVLLFVSFIFLDEIILNRPKRFAEQRRKRHRKRVEYYDEDEYFDDEYEAYDESYNEPERHPPRRRERVQPQQHTTQPPQPDLVQEDDEDEVELTYTTSHVPKIIKDERDVYSKKSKIKRLQFDE